MLVDIRTYPAGLHLPRHAHDTMSITVVLAASLRERVGGIEETAQPLSLVIKPVGVEHENQFGPSAVRTLQLLLDAGEAADLTKDCSALRDWRWIHGGSYVHPFLVLARAVLAGDPAGVELSAVDALAAIEEPPWRSRGEPPVVTRVRRRLEDEVRPPRVHALARDAGVHPVYLARIFRRYVGTSMAQYLRRTRVRKVIAQLHPDTALSRAAHEAGFADHAHMCRAFRAETGIAPSEYRVLLTG